MNTLREVCKCGHDKATHFKGKHNCLGLYCNDCKEYRNEWEDDAPITVRAPPSDDWPYP